jgi:hypothetical protein
MKTTGSIPASQRRFLLLAGLVALGTLSPLSAQMAPNRRLRNDLRTNGFTGQWTTSLITTSSGYSIQTLPRTAGYIVESTHTPHLRLHTPLVLCLLAGIGDASTSIYRTPSATAPSPSFSSFGSGPWSTTDSPAWSAAEMEQLGRKINALGRKTLKTLNKWK